MSIVAVHGPNTFGSKAVTEVGPAMASVTPPGTDGLKWTFKLDQPSTRTASLAWTFPTGTPASATGPGPHAVTFASPGTKAVTAVATGAGEGANPYPPAGTTNLPVTAVTGNAPQLLMGAPEEGDGAEIPAGFDPAAHTVQEVEEYVEENPHEAQTVFDLEEAGKQRVTLLNWLSQYLE